MLGRSGHVETIDANPIDRLKCPLKRHIRGRRRLHPGVVVERVAGELNEIGFTDADECVFIVPRAVIVRRVVGN